MDRTMAYREIPSDHQVVATLRDLGGTATALDLCERLVRDGHPRRDSQLAIQRAAERGLIAIGSGWRLSIVREEAAA